MSPFRVLTFLAIILVAGSTGAQVDGYTCTNAYLDCGDVVESEDYIIRAYNTIGWPGDTIWLPVGIGVTPDTIAAFVIFIDWDSTYLSPLTDPSDSIVVQHRRLGLFESVDGDFFAMLSQNPADEGAIAMFYNLSMPNTTSKMPPGDYGAMFSVGFVVKPDTPPGAFSVFGFHQVNEYVVTDSAAMEAFCQSTMTAR